MKYLKSSTYAVYQKKEKKKKTDDLITACKYFHGKKMLSTNWLVNLAQEGIYKTKHYLEAEAKFK